MSQKSVARRSLATFFALIPCLSAPLALANPVPKSCALDSSGSYLAHTETGVVADDPTFTHNGVDYLTSIHGLAEVDPRIPGPPYRLCRRYEFRNTSAGPIDEFRWLDVGIGHISTIEAGDGVRHLTPTPHNTAEVRPASTDLYAWENERANGISVFPVKVEVEKETKIDFEPGKMYAVPATQFADALKEISPSGMILEASYAFFQPEEIQELPILESGFSSGSVNIEIRSWATAFPGDRFVTSAVELVYSWEREGQAAVYAPGLQSLDQVDFTARNDALETLSSLKNLSESASEFEVKNGNFTKFDFSYSHSNDFSEPIMYVVEQPVRLAVGEWSACFVASVYAPIPISLEAQTHCDQ